MKKLPIRLLAWRFRKSYWIFSLTFLVAWVINSQTQLRECLSYSLNGVHYILFLKSQSIKRGDIVSIQGHKEDHIGDLKKWPYSKRVLGIPGDHVIYNGSGIAVIPRESYSLSLLSRTSKGKPLTPIVPLNGLSVNAPPFNDLTNSIPKGYLFVAGDNPQSFDSRYEEFGLVPIEKVWGKGILAW